MAGTFPSRDVWRRPSLRPVDLIVFAARGWLRWKKVGV